MMGLHSAVKAKFQILHPRDGKWTDPLEVMFNPSEISFNNYYKTELNPSMIGTGGILAGKGKKERRSVTLIKTCGPTSAVVSMRLYFDLVPAYEAALKKKPFTANLANSTKILFTGMGLGTSGGIGDLAAQADDDQGHLVIANDKTQINLLEPRIGKIPNPYYNLYVASLEQMHICFAWANMIFYGRLTDFNSTFTYFSKNGTPLRAEVNITIQQEGSENYNNADQLRKLKEYLTDSKATITQQQEQSQIKIEEGAPDDSDDELDIMGV